MNCSEYGQFAPHPVSRLGDAAKQTFKWAIMALRVFADDSGQEWNAWDVQPSESSALVLSKRFQRGWLCFERVDGSLRCRVSLDDVPPGWDALPAHHLVQLLTKALSESTVQRQSARTTTGVERSAAESAARERVSGPRESIGSDDIS